MRDRAVALAGLALVAVAASAEETARPVDRETGLTKDEAGNWQTTRDRCTECHSAQLLTQNRTDRDGWVRTVQRMLKEEGLEPLGDLEKPILDYLSTYYGEQLKPTRLGRRRAPLRQPPVGGPP